MNAPEMLFVYEKVEIVIHLHAGRTDKVATICLTVWGS